MLCGYPYTVARFIIRLIKAHEKLRVYRPRRKYIGLDVKRLPCSSSKDTPLPITKHGVPRTDHRL